MTGLSIFASFVGGCTIMGNTNLMFEYGFPMLFFVFALPTGLLILKRFSSGLHKKSREEGWLTYYDMFNSKFGSDVKNIVAVIQIVALILIAAVALIGGAKMIEMLVNISYEMSVLLMAGVVGVYLMISGFSSVVKTDFIQGIFLLVIFAGFLVFSLFMPTGIESYSDFQFKEIGFVQPFLFAIIALIFIFGDEGIFQRVYAAKDVKTVKKSLNFAFVVYMIFYIVLSASIFKLKALYPELSGDMAFIGGLAKLIPESFQWLIAIAVLSVVLSSIDTYVFAAVMNINKIIADKKGEGNHDKLVKNIKITLPIVFVGLIFIALYIKSVMSTVYIYSALNGCNALIVILSLMIPNLGRLYALVPIILNLVFLTCFIILQGCTPKMVVVPFVSVFLGMGIVFVWQKILKKHVLSLNKD